MPPGGKVNTVKNNKSGRYDPVGYKSKLLLKPQCIEILDVSSGDESLIPCNQHQYVETLASQFPSLDPEIFCSSSNIFQSTPKPLKEKQLTPKHLSKKQSTPKPLNEKHSTWKSFDKNSLKTISYLHSKIKNNSASHVCEENLSVSTLDSIFNTSFNNSGEPSRVKDDECKNSDILSIFNSSDCLSDFEQVNKTINSEHIKTSEKNYSASGKSEKNQSNSFYGLPLNVKSLVKQYKGIDKLYDWQDECLTLSAIENHCNLIYALPTSGGKTLVAEILMLKEILIRKKNVLFILPFVSIVQEKVWALSPFAVNLNFLIEEYAGGKGVLPPRKRHQKKSIYIATIEKGLMLIRSLIETKRLGEIGLVVVDELHLLGESNRGPTLEVLLTNILYSQERIQIIGMSATIGNIEELAKFIKAEVFLKDFRPVELKEYIKVGSDIYSINYNLTDEDNFTLHRKVKFQYSPEATNIDGDHLGGLVSEVIPKGSCLIFCPTKKNCENVASVVLRSILPKKLLEYRKREKTALQDALKIESDGRSSLIDLVVWGIGFHHAGLAFEERRLIEEAFRSGVLNVLCCTSTLAAGVNLPAQRVILRAPLVGKNFISLSMYKQMVGRAGRAGFGGHGDSILICPSHYLEKVKALLSSPMENVNSNLHINEGTHMRSFVLGSIASDIATTRAKLRELLSKSLLSVQAQRLDINVKEHLDMAIKKLIHLYAIEIKNQPLKTLNTSNTEASVTINQTLNSDVVLEECSAKSKTRKAKYEITRDSELTVSKLGRAAVKGCFSLCHARWLYSDLKQAQECLVLTDVLHLLYLVTPYDVAENIRPDWTTYKAVLEGLSDDSVYTVRLIGFTEYSIVKMSSRKMPKNMSQRVFNRFYVTLMLNDLWKQETLQDVSEKYGVSRGVVQLLMEQSAAFCSSVIRFCEELEEFWAFKDLLVGFSTRLSHCCIQELVPLMELPNVKKNRAMQLYKAGFKTLKSIAQSEANALTECIEHLPFRTAKQLIAAAKLLLLEKVENLREQAQEFMDADLFT